MKQNDSLFNNFQNFILRNHLVGNKYLTEFFEILPSLPPSRIYILENLNNKK